MAGIIVLGSWHYFNPFCTQIADTQDGHVIPVA